MIRHFKKLNKNLVRISIWHLCQLYQISFDVGRKVTYFPRSLTQYNAQNPLKVDDYRTTLFYGRMCIRYFTLLWYVEQRTIDAGIGVFMVVAFRETFTQKSFEHDIDTWKESVRIELLSHKWSPNAVTIIWPSVLTVNLWTYGSRECSSLENFPLEQRYDNKRLAQLHLWETVCRGKIIHHLQIHLTLFRFC